jgi:hypothetical protein
MHYFRTDVPQTAAELFDGELVIANYQSGLYYSITSAGALVWQGLRHGLSDDAVVEWLAAGYPSESDLGSRVSAFIGQMVEQGLLIPAEASAAGPELPVLPADLGPMDVEKFEYLQELLLLDPVHDVEQAGWPHRPNDAD